MPFEEQYKEPRTIQDEDIERTIRLLKTKTASLGNFEVYNACSMLEELLKLRQKVRNDATS